MLDSMEIVHIHRIRICLLLSKLKKEIEEGGSDATTHSTQSYKRTWTLGDVRVSSLCEYIKHLIFLTQKS